MAKKSFSCYGNPEKVANIVSAVVSYVNHLEIYRKLCDNLTARKIHGEAMAERARNLGESVPKNVLDLLFVQKVINKEELEKILEEE